MRLTEGCQAPLKSDKNEMTGRTDSLWDRLRALQSKAIRCRRLRAEAWKERSLAYPARSAPLTVVKFLIWNEMPTSLYWPTRALKNLGLNHLLCCNLGTHTKGRLSGPCSSGAVLDFVFLSHSNITRHQASIAVFLSTVIYKSQRVSYNETAKRTGSRNVPLDLLSQWGHWTAPRITNWTRSLLRILLVNYWGYPSII
jgi:hypothetical protein